MRVTFLQRHGGSVRVPGRKGPLWTRIIASNTGTASSGVFEKLYDLRDGDCAPMVISSGFRSIACTRSVGGAANSLHTYGMSADLGTASAPGAMPDVACRP